MEGEGEEEEEVEEEVEVNAKMLTILLCCDNFFKNIFVLVGIWIFCFDSNRDV